MMIPQVARTTEEIVRTVPVSLREAALALGYARWRTSLTIVLRTASAGHRHRRAGRDRPHCRRDGTAAVHSVRQPVLVDHRSISRSPRSRCRSTPMPSAPTTTGTRKPGPAPSCSSRMILIISLVARVATRRRFAGTVATELSMARTVQPLPASRRQRCLGPSASGWCGADRLRDRARRRIPCRAAVAPTGRPVARARCSATSPRRAR